ncbi:MAG: MFS transporter [Anaerolineae bacterium]|nr:MFS transporter [Anaerolineae bacterium]
MTQPANSIRSETPDAVATGMSTGHTRTISARRRWFIVTLILIPVFIGALDLTIVSAILPEILTRLSIPVDTNLGAAAWAVTGYLLAYIVSMTVSGRVSDLVGRRAVYLVCLGIFIFGSYWVATAHEWPTDMLNLFARQVLRQRPDLNQLTLIAVIIGRVIQALGAGAMVPVSMALVADLFPPDRRSQPVGIIGAVDTLGWVLGHLYGGVMVNYFNQNGASIAASLRQIGLNWPPPDWHTLFYLNVPIGVIALILTWLALRGIDHPTSEGKFDWIGALLLSGSLIGLNLGLGGNTEISTTRALNETQQTAFNPTLLIVAALCFVVFLFYEWRIAHPLFELHLFRKRNVASATLTNLLIGFCLMLGLVSVPLLVNLRAEDASAASISQAAERAGILLSALTVPMALAALPGGWLAERRGYRFPTMIGLAIATAGFLIAGLTWKANTPDATMALHMIIAGVGLGLTISPIGTAVINDASESQRGVASALVLILRLVGMTIAVSSLTTFALSRVNYLVGLASAQFSPTLTPVEIQAASVQAYFASGVQVIGEMLVIGAVVCALSLIPAYFLRGSGKAAH